MARKNDERRHRLNLDASANAVVDVLRAELQRMRFEHDELLRRLEAAARCGALFAGAAGAVWGIA